MLVEDDPDHGDFFCSALEESRLPVEVHMIDRFNCLEALREGGLVSEMVLIDLDDNAVEGRSLLSDIRADAEFRHLPVLMLTDEEDPDELHDLYMTEVTACIRRPMDLKGYRSLVRSLHAFWFQHARLCPDLVTPEGT